MSAGDEFMKSMTFKARAAAQINSRIARENPEVFTRLDNFTTALGQRYYKYKSSLKIYERVY